MDKPIDWRGSSLKDLREFPEKIAKRDVEIARIRYRAVARERKASK
jgi:phage-related protein